MDVLQRHYVMKMVDNGVRDVAQQFVNKHGRNPESIIAWHRNMSSPKV